MVQSFLKNSLTKCLTLLLLLTAYISGAQNLIINGSFTNATANWQFIAPATEVEAYFPEITYGGTSATNTIAEVDEEANLRQTDINVVAGQTYWLSFKTSRRTLGGAPLPTEMNVRVYNGTNNFLDQTITSSNINWDLLCNTFQFTPTSNTVDIDFVSLSTSTLGTMVDDITITPMQQVINITGTPCQGGNITMNAPSFPNDPDAVYADYNWSGPNGFTATTDSISLNNLQPSMAGDYTCTMKLNTCLTVTGTYHLDVAPTNSSETISICLGESYNFYGKTLTQPGYYDTLLDNTNGCDNRVTLQLIVNPRPDATIRPMGHLDICEGDTLLLSSLNALPNCSYRWYNNATLATNETSNTFYAYASGSYHVEVISNEGCNSISAPVTLTVHQPPVASIKINEADNPCISDTLHFMALNESASYNWSPAAIFRNTESIDQRNATGIIKNEKTTIVLSVYDEYGCNTSDSVLVHARPCCYLFLPNAFSPNGDALNDVFKPTINATQKIISFKIFDRWGKMVYINTGNASDGWNGNYPNGNKASGDVYMYSLEYTCGDSKIEFKKGDVLLIRQ